MIAAAGDSTCTGEAERVPRPSGKVTTSVDATANMSRPIRDFLRLRALPVQDMIRTQSLENEGLIF
jgi:hypothetical protein